MRRKKKRKKTTFRMQRSIETKRDSLKTFRKKTVLTTGSELTSIPNVGYLHAQAVGLRCMRGDFSCGAETCAERHRKMARELHKTGFLKSQAARFSVRSVISSTRATRSSVFVNNDLGVFAARA